MIFNFASLCIPLGVFYYYYYFKSQLESPLVFKYFLGWILCASSGVLQLLNLSFIPEDLIQTLFTLSLGFLTIQSAIIFLKLAPKEQIVSQKREKALGKIPFLGAFLYLTVYEEIGKVAFEWFHWATHLGGLLIIFISRDMKSFYLYTISTVLVSFYYLFEDVLNLSDYKTALFSLMSAFVILTFVKTNELYENEISTDIP